MKKNNKTLLLYIKHNKKMPAQCFYNYYCSSKDIINICIDIINNYNKNLSNCFLPDDVLAIRMLELSDRHGRNASGGSICLATFEKMLDKYPTLIWNENHRYENKRISINEKEDECLQEGNPTERTVVVIDFDKKVINADLIFYAIKKDELPLYENKKLQTCNYDVKQIPFNELYDFLDFLTEAENCMINIPLLDENKYTTI